MIYLMSVNFADERTREEDDVEDDTDGIDDAKTTNKMEERIFEI